VGRSHAADTQLLDAVLHRAIETGRVPGVLAAVSDSTHTLYSRAYGSAQAAAGTAMSCDSIVRIASMTKVVTTVAVMLLLEDGLIDLDAPFARYLPGYRQPEVIIAFDRATGTYKTRPARSEITIRQLLSHTSGYGYWFLDARLRQLAGDSPDLLNAPFLIADPGERFSYGTSTDVLGQIFQPVAGLSIDEFFAQRVFEPLGMIDTSFRLPHDSGRLASVFNRTRAGFTELENESADSVPRGGGGLFSTTGDYITLLRVLLNAGLHDGKRFMRADSVAEICRNQLGESFANRQTTAFPERSNDFIFMDGTQKFGLGVMIETRDQPSGRSVGAYGWGGIFNTYFWVDPQAQIAATIMMQVRPFADPACVELSREFESGVYANLT